MADRNNADSRRHLAVVTPSPPPIPKDVHGTDNLPLSPQWLLPKPGENKLGTAPRDFNQYGTQPDTVKNGEDLNNTGKRRDVFRPSMHDGETGRHDRWRDEEREPNSAIRRERWRDVDKVERWSDNSSRHSGESRRAMWSDSGNKEGNYDQRRENKWNTRWGPDDKEPESWREKWADPSHLSSHGKDTNNLHEKDTDREDHYSRQRRSNYSVSRGRGDPVYPPSQTPQKPSTVFGYGRGRTENESPVTISARGKLNSNSTVNSGSSRPFHLGSALDKSDSAPGNPCVKYSRMKLLDVYRVTDLKKVRANLDGFIEVPPLTELEPLEPLALSAPTSEESVILKGIDKGDIISSGVPQGSKDGSVGRNISDAIPPKQAKLGSREDRPAAMDDYKDDNTDNMKGTHFGSFESSLGEKQLQHHGSEQRVGLNLRQYSFQEKTQNADGILENPDKPAIIEASRPEISPSLYVAGPRRSQSVGDYALGSSHDWKEFSTENGPRTSEMSWSQLQKDESHWQKDEGFGPQPDPKNDPKIKRQLSDVLNREGKSSIMLGHEDSYNRRLQAHPSPEELSLYYKDPQGQIQGPFSGSDLIGWFEAGYFGIDLLVRLSSAPPDAPFSLLGDVMPHLRAKARPPPGFGTAAKPNELSEISIPSKFAGSTNIHAGMGDVDILNNGSRIRKDAATEAQNRFIESLMSGSISSSPLEKIALTGGMQEYGGSSAVGGESENDVNYLLAQRRLLERQKSSSNSLQFWPGRDVTQMVPNINAVSDSSPLHSKLLPPMGDASRQILQSPQQVDLLSILHSAADKPQNPAISGLPLWSNFPEARNMSNTLHGNGMGISQNPISMQHNLNIPPQIGVGIQQQRLLQQNQPPLPHLSPQPIDIAPALLPPDKLPSEIPQDPQLLSLLQQQAQEALQINQQMSIQSLLDPQPPNRPDVSLGISPANLPHHILNHVPSKEWDTSLPQQAENIVNADTATVSAMAEMNRRISLEKNNQGLENAGAEHKTLSVSQSSEVIAPACSEAKDTAESKANDPGSSDRLTYLSDQVHDMKLSLKEVSEQIRPDSSLAKETKSVETPEVKKTSEKKSKKQKNSKAQSAADAAGKGQSKTTQSKVASEVEGSDAVVTAAKPEMLNDTEGSAAGASVEEGELDFIKAELPSSKNDSVRNEVDHGELVNLSSNAQTASSHRAWKPAFGLRPKSLLEIQAEEQLRAQREAMPAEFAKPAAPTSVSSSVPWSGVVPTLEPKFNPDVTQQVVGSSGNAANSKSKKSPLHDLLAEEVLAKSNEVEKDLGGSNTKTDMVVLDDDDFIEAKDSKKNRKKASKAKGAGLKSPSPVGSLDQTATSVRTEKGKSTQKTQEREISPAPPSGPSLGDFVLWKEDQTVSAPAPAWSADPVNLQKPLSLREIQREQERKAASIQQQIPIPSATKQQPTRGNRGSGSSWQFSGSSPSNKAAAPIQTSSHVSSVSKSKGEDDLFWGPPEQSKQEAKQSDFPSLSNQSGWGVKGSFAKGALSVAPSRQKSQSGKLPLSSPPTSSGLSIAKGSKDASSKQSDAVDFRNWCESEWVKLTGTNDTSFLEYCIKQSASEAETLLRENLGSLDRNYEFIDKFLNYKAFLSSEVVEMAFQLKISRPTGADDADTEAGADGAAKGGGGKKKAKKGKKVSLSALGFNVVSNRIMMGEIQNVDD
ncbi:PERQ amino acid-rich with GYF domain-containing protein 2 [Ananas comosus]|uniref:PERQ amino acid-rich with GYF domain-containing protein 2 n=1 Tax=Ananas comosus TaxID=4615 RepID=A0A199V9W4_ANACO|nr:PERQ amino acid-rich with GYF domain-containing protein 2 [Ananas comosus]